MESIISGQGPEVAARTVAQASEASRASLAATSNTTQTTAQNGDGLQGISLIDASATLSVGRNLVANYVIGADSHLAQIRLIDPTTHQVIAESPPDSIMRMQQEVQAYQGVANQAKAV